MKNKSYLSFSTFTFIIFLLFFSFSILNAQENGIYEIDGYTITSKQSSEKSKNKSDRDEFEDLAFNLHPTYYLNKNNIKKSNHKELAVLKLTFFDTASFNVLTKDDSNYKSVELITINLKTLSDLNNKLNLSNIQVFNNLKYIFIKCYFKCTEQQLKEFVKHNSNIRVFYRVENPS